MAELQLNFNEAKLDKESVLYALYSRLHDGMRKANSYTPPDYVANPLRTPEGEIDYPAIEQALASRSAIQMKNAAYMIANAIISSIGEGGGSGGKGNADSLLRTGDSMTGALGALQGFQAGKEGQVIFETLLDVDQNKQAVVHGKLQVDGNVSSSGSLRLDGTQIAFGDHPAITYTEGILSLNADAIAIDGALALKADLGIGNVSITTDGVFFDGNTYYHAGNSNKKSVDWDMKDAHVFGNITVEGVHTSLGRLTALQGFDLGEQSKKLIYSATNKKTQAPEIHVASDILMASNHGIKIGSFYALKEWSGTNNVLSLAAPGRVLNLGDTEGTTETLYIALQTDLKNYTGTQTLVSKNGDGRFPNSFFAGCGNGGPMAIQTYYQSSNDCGLVVGRNLRLGASNGPLVTADNTGKSLSLTLPTTTGSIQSKLLSVQLNHVDTTSLFRDLSITNSSTLQIDTDGEFVAFKKPIESRFFSIISDQYKTKLGENILFFNDNSFIEGTADGLRVTGNLHLSKNATSSRFARGFAGYGWGIVHDETAGGIEATFDALVVRKKMRVYELDVQKQSITNGSLWISNFCSGDTVEEIN